MAKSLMELYGGGMVYPANNYQLGGLIAKSRRGREYQGEMRELRKQAMKDAEERRKYGIAGSAASFVTNLFAPGAGGFVKGLIESQYDPKSFEGGKYALQTRGELGEAGEEWKKGIFERGFVDVAQSLIMPEVFEKAGETLKSGLGKAGEKVAEWGADKPKFLGDWGARTYGVGGEEFAKEVTAKAHKDMPWLKTEMLELGEEGYVDFFSDPSYFGGEAVSTGEGAVTGVSSAAAEEAAAVVLPEVKPLKKPDWLGYGKGQWAPGKYLGGALLGVGKGLKSMKPRRMEGVGSMGEGWADVPTMGKKLQNWWTSLKEQQKQKRLAGAGTPTKMLFGRSSEGVPPPPSGELLGVPPPPSGEPLGAPPPPSYDRPPTPLMQTAADIYPDIHEEIVGEGFGDIPFEMPAQELFTPWESPAPYQSYYGPAFAGGGLIDYMMPRGMQEGGYATATDPLQALEQMGFEGIADDPELQQYMEDLPQFQQGYAQQVGDITTAGQQQMGQLGTQMRQQQAQAGFAGAGIGAGAAQQARAGVGQEFQRGRRGIVESYQADLLAGIRDIETKGEFEFGDSGTIDAMSPGSYTGQTRYVGGVGYKWNGISWNPIISGPTGQYAYGDKP